MGGRELRDATTAEVERLTRSLVAARAFADARSLLEEHARAPWRIQVSGRGDVVVCDRWRDHLPYLAIDALWCPVAAVPDMLGQVRRLAGSLGLTDVVSPPTRLEEAHHLERAGMRAETTVAVLAHRQPDTAPPSAVPDLPVRPATSGDADALLAVDAACFPPFWRYDRRHLQRFLVTGRLAVAERSGRALGYTLTTIDGEDAMLGRLCVAPDARREGVGRALLAEAMRHAASCGAARMTLSTQTDNAPSQALYRAAGFRDTGLRYVFLRFGADEG